MTTKIQNIAMFAIAAFALGGMMVTPAFATSEPHTLTVTAPAWGSSSDGDDSPNACGGGYSPQSNLTVWNWAEDSIIVSTDADNCPTHYNTSIVVKLNGNVIYTTSTTADTKTFFWAHDIDEDDVVLVKVTYFF